MDKRKFKKIYFERLTAKLNTLTQTEKERMDGVTEMVHQLLKEHGLEYMKFEYCHSPFYVGVCHINRIKIDLLMENMFFS